MIQKYSSDVLRSNPVLRNQEELTEATCILAGMRRDDARAFERALGFKFITEDMSPEERYDRLYAFCKYGSFAEEVFPVEGDSYANGDEWQALWDSTMRRVAEYERK